VSDTSPSAWHWCPECRIAASKPGLCPGCGRGYIPVPEGGVPGEPFRPSLQRSGGGLIGILTGVLALAVVGGAAFGVVQLYLHGQRLDASGQPVSSASTAPAAAAAAAPSPTPGSVDCTNTLGTCTFAIPPLHASITLPGAWASGTFADSVTSPIVGEVGGPVTVDVSVSSGTGGAAAGDLGVVHIDTADPGTLASELLSAITATTNAGNGDTVSFASLRQLTIAGVRSVAQDYTITGSGGATVEVGTFYFVNGGSALVVIQSDAIQSTLLTQIEQALVAMG
jgi:hypothetical protein